jgi:hypothetical protein
MVTCTVAIGVLEHGTLATLHVTALHVTALHLAATHLTTLHVTAHHSAALTTLHAVLSTRHTLTRIVALTGIVAYAVAIFVDEVVAHAIAVGILPAWAESLAVRLLLPHHVVVHCTAHATLALHHSLTGTGDRGGRSVLSRCNAGKDQNEDQ